MFAICLGIRKAAPVDATHSLGDVLTVLLTPLGLVLFVQDTFGKSYQVVLDFMWKVSAVIAGLACIATFTSLIHPEDYLTLYQGLFLPGCLLFIGMAVNAAREGDHEAKLFILGMTAIAVCGAIRG